MRPQTPYGKMMEDNRREARRKKKRVPKDQAAARGRCGAKLRRKVGQYCQLPAGWGTDHPRIGRCKNHGGSLPNVKANIAKQQAIFMGAPKDISPLDAIIWCIKITAGEVEWLSQQIAEIQDEDEWFEHTVLGRQMNVLQRARGDAQDRLVRYSKDAVSLGLAERAVRLAEQFGATIARLLEGIRMDLSLNGEQKKRWPIIVRKHLILLDGGNVIEQDDRIAPLVALPKKTGKGNQ